ncbi:MAG TPA: DNA-directed RNA polymerase subunit omega [bacterium]|nr:DNA-directed RNA polymerase subunit omega [bacterium]
MGFEEFVTDESFKEFSGNKYMLVNVAAMRARQVNDGVELYVRAKSRHPLQISLEEISEGFIDFAYGYEDTESEFYEMEDEIVSFDEMVNLEGDFDFEDEEALDIEPMDLEDEFADYDDIDTTD